MYAPAAAGVLATIKSNAKKLLSKVYDYDPKLDPITDSYTVSLKHGFAVAMALDSVDRLFDGVEGEIPEAVRAAAPAATAPPAVVQRHARALGFRSKLVVVGHAAPVALVFARFRMSRLGCTSCRCANRGWTW